ncbi:MAG: hypothetical protein HWN67_12300 [Candidatus Helarchaeota archaeon]|nr:hypothetical protein [Candidatus Helarchaeota archaeon]
MNWCEKGLFSELNEIPRDILKALLTKEGYWYSLIQTCNDLDYKILNVMYTITQTLTFEQLLNKLRYVNYSSKTIRKTLKKLKNLGLIEIVPTKPLIIRGDFELEDKVRNLLKILRKTLLLDVK